jgi:striatin 1/3/4
MRFLQSEWHRHERERNAWDIEKQEMKARIAQLEGKIKRGDATQNASKKYIKILQRKIKEQSAQLQSEGKWDPAEGIAAEKESRSVMVQEKLNCEYPPTALPP